MRLGDQFDLLQARQSLGLLNAVVNVLNRHNGPDIKVVFVLCFPLKDVSAKDQPIHGY
jgi:hypothetical protein